MIYVGKWRYPRGWFSSQSWGEWRSWDCHHSQIFWFGNIENIVKMKSERRQSGYPGFMIVCFYVLGLCKSSWPEALAFMLQVKSNSRYLRLYWNIHQPLLSELLFILGHRGRWDKRGFSHLQLNLRAAAIHSIFQVLSNEINTTISIIMT